MPLEHSKSPEAFKHNIKAEIKAKKPIHQALAIAYAEKRKNDILPTKSYNRTIESYGLSSLKNENGAVTSPQQARQIASQQSGQSENTDPRKFKITTKDKHMSETIIPASNRTSKKHPGENQKYVGSREGGPAEQSRTKASSLKHMNPEYFKRQSDRKNYDAQSNENVGRGVGKIGTADIGKKDCNIFARKDVPIQRDFNHHQKNVGSDPGRGVGQIGKDSKKK